MDETKGVALGGGAGGKVKKPGKRGRKPVKIDLKAKLERSRQSARECRARKKQRYQRLEEMVSAKERSICALREELEMYKQWCSAMDQGTMSGVRDFLAQFQWDPGMALPVANAENAALELKLKQRQEQMKHLQQDLQQQNEIVQAMKKHLHSVHADLRSTQELFMARERERETEKHFEVVSSREHKRLQLEIKHLEEELATQQDVHNQKQVLVCCMLHLSH
uniref:cAMP-responsive element-binding protein-like 2 n=1 Tax=Eptatretus burgeri TaxID=7764 RepID=A0A8C4R547_EPTBU